MSRPTPLRTMVCGPNPTICTRNLDGPDGVLVAKGGSVIFFPDDTFAEQVEVLAECDEWSKPGSKW